MTFNQCASGEPWVQEKRGRRRDGNLNAKEKEERSLPQLLFPLRLNELCTLRWPVPGRFKSIVVVPVEADWEVGAPIHEN